MCVGSDLFKEVPPKGKTQMYVAGVDEVGRGPLAGPVVTAAVILASPIDGRRDGAL